MFTKDFWDDRAIRHGHTGHSEPFLYCFDQEARKFAIEKIIDHLFPVRKDKALDYGCGSGEFVPLLKEKFSYVLGYDISDHVLNIAATQNAGMATFTTDKIVVRDNSLYDLVLTVTVLHALTENELKKALKEISLLLSSNGYLVAMEFFVSDRWSASNDEQRVTTTAWKELLQQNELTVVSQHSFYNAVMHPTPSWKEYTANKFLKVLKLIKHTGFAKRIFSDTARKIIHEKKDVLNVENNTFMIYVLQKTTHAD